MQYVGPAADAGKYRYKLQFVNKEGTLRLGVCLCVRSLNEDLSEHHNSEDCVILYPYQYNVYANKGSELSFSIQIVTI